MSGGDGETSMRAARESDIDRLEEIEQCCFSGDRLSRRSFRNLIRSPSALLVVAENAGILGYALTLTRRNSKSARLYSLAIQPQSHKQGLGMKLVKACEEAARLAGCTRIVLEVRADNVAAIALYQRMGYRRFGTAKRYYEDGEDALRFEKDLPGSAPRLRDPQ